MARDQALTDAVFPSVAPAAGHYESYYLRAVSPDRPQAVWIRYTVHKEPGRPPVGSMWCTLFDGTPRAVKQTHPGPTSGAWIEIGGCKFGPGRAEGRAQALGHEGAWELTFGEGTGAVHHLPKPWMYHARLPRTKTLSPVSDTTFTGWVEVDGHRVAVDGWRGMVGHNWGSEHAERWIWLHGIGFPDAPDAWVDLVAGRIKVGPAVTPWIANGVLHLDGSTRPLGGLAALRSTSVRETPTQVELDVPGVHLESRHPPEGTVAWLYADPGHAEHHNVTHSSVASMAISVDGRTLRTAHGACYELGMREATHGVALQPFPDG